MIQLTEAGLRVLQLEAEVEKLRTALRELAFAVEQYEPNDGDDLADLQWKAEHALAALEPSRG